MFEPLPHTSPDDDEIGEPEAGEITGLGYIAIMRRRQRYERLLAKARRAEHDGDPVAAQGFRERLAQIDLPPFRNLKPGVRYRRSLCEAWRQAHEYVVPPASADLSGATPRPVSESSQDGPSCGDERAREAS